jgi:hypothetical protein
MYVLSNRQKGAHVALTVGFALALLFSLLARGVGFDRDRAFYPTVLVVIASYYVLFAVIGGSVQVILAESAMMAAFLLLAIAGFKSSLWLVVIALAGHGVLDLFHSRLLTNPGVPEWWPAFCLTYDIGAAGFLAWLLTRSDSPLRIYTRSR